MANLTIKNLPEVLYNELKVCANKAHRSLNNEVIYRLEASYRAERQFDAEAFLTKVRSLRQKTINYHLTADNIDQAVSQG